MADNVGAQAFSPDQLVIRLRVRAIEGRKAGMIGEICFRSKYKPDFRVRFNDGSVIRCIKTNKFTIHNPIQF